MNSNSSGLIHDKFNTTDEIIKNAFFSDYGDKLGQEYKRRILAEFAPNASLSMSIPVMNAALNSDINGLGVPIPNLNLPITTTNPLLSCLTSTTPFIANPATGASVHSMASQPLSYNPTHPSTSYCDLTLQYLASLHCQPFPQPMEEMPSYPNIMDSFFQQINRSLIAAQLSNLVMANAKPQVASIPQQHLYNPNIFQTKAAFPFASTVPSPSGSSTSSCNVSEIDSLEDRLDDIPMRKKERAALVPTPDAPKTPTVVRVPKRAKTSRAKPFENFQFQIPETSARSIDDSKNSFINGQHLLKADSSDTSPPFLQKIPADFSFFYQDMDHENDVSHVPTIVPHQKKFNVSTSEEQRTESSISPSHAVPVNSSSGSHSPELNVFAFGETAEKRRKVDDVTHAFNESGNVKSHVGRVTEESKNLHHLLNNPLVLQELLKSPAFINSDLAKSILGPGFINQSVVASLTAQATQAVKPPANPTFAVPTVPEIKTTWTPQTPVTESSIKPPTSKTNKQKLKCRKRKIRPLFLLKNAEKKLRGKKRLLKSISRNEESRESVESSKIPDDPAITDTPVTSTEMVPEDEASFEIESETIVEESDETLDDDVSPETAISSPDLESIEEDEEVEPLGEDDRLSDDLTVVDKAQWVNDCYSEDDTYFGNGRRNMCLRPLKRSHFEEHTVIPRDKSKIIVTPEFFEDMVVIGVRARSFPIKKSALGRSRLRKAREEVRRGPKRLAAVVAAAAVRSDSIPMRLRRGMASLGTYTAQDEIDTAGNAVVTHDPSMSCGSTDYCRHPDQLSLSWIRCDHCLTWFHRICVQYLIKIRVLNCDLFCCGCSTTTSEPLLVRSFITGRKPHTSSLIEKIVNIANIQIAYRKQSSTTGEDPNKFDSTVSREDLDEIEEFLNSEADMSATPEEPKEPPIDDISEVVIC